MVAKTKYVGALVAVGLLVLMLVVLEPRSAEAAFPGKNGKIAFAGLHPEDASTTNNWDIYTVNADGSGLVQITNNPAVDLLPAWSPDGSKIAFMSNRANSLDIFIMDADGGNVRRLTNNGRYNFNPSWSPDGTKIAFVGTPPEPGGNTGTKNEIYTINVDGTGEKALTNNTTSDNSPDWSPDGRRIVFEGSNGINVMNADGTEQRLLTPGGQYPTWSPDGSKIAFITGDGTGDDEIATVNSADGSGRTLITDTPDLIGTFLDWQPQPTTPSDTMPPKVVSHAPKGNADEVAPTANFRATFSEEMDRNTINGQTFKLFKKGTTTQIPATVSYNADTDTAKLDPTNNLRRGVAYKAVVTTWAKDMAGNRLDQDGSTTGFQQMRWFFRVDD